MVKKSRSSKRKSEHQKVSSLNSVSFLYPDNCQVSAVTDSELCLELAWSPDGTMLAYIELKAKGKIFNPDEMDGDLYIVPASGGESKRITNTP